ncbi:hypothetical protein Ait01nite_063000 [Actinoplanes italicus]|nr:hypothetical protein Ait01nite_063000 [Actinoplanes italicus]
MGRPNPLVAAPAGAAGRGSGDAREKSPSVSITTDSTGLYDPIRNATCRLWTTIPSSHDTFTESV